VAYNPADTPEAAVPFAEVEDVATRLGRALTDEEGGQVVLLLEMAEGTIAAAADKTDEWATSLDPVPNILKLYAIELVVRTMRNPGGLRSRSKTLGQFQSSETFADPGNGGGMALTELEIAVIRRAVYGRTSGSARSQSVAHDIYPCPGS
jgi:hypothetical protein